MEKSPEYPNDYLKFCYQADWPATCKADEYFKEISDPFAYYDSLKSIEPRRHFIEMAVKGRTNALSEVNIIDESIDDGDNSETPSRAKLNFYKNILSGTEVSAVSQRRSYRADNPRPIFPFKYPNLPGLPEDPREPDWAERQLPRGDR
jgi:hypothetical protein